MRDRLLGNRVSPTPDTEDRGPLQTLGAVDGQQLDRVGSGRGGDVEAVALVVLGGEVGEQGRQRDVAVDGLELRHGLHEEVEVVAAGGGGRADRGGQLDVDAGGVDDRGGRCRGAARRRGCAARELAGQQAEPLSGLRGVRAVTRVGERVVERRDLGDVDAVGDAQELLGDRGGLAAAAAPAISAARRPAARRSRGPIAQRGPVSSVSTAVLAVTSWSSRSVATISATSGSRSSPDRPTISTGIPAPVSASKTSSAGSCRG